MTLKLDSNLAKAADNIATGIRESGKYVGIITRAEKLVSRDKGTIGLGLSFKSDTGQTAEYLDIYHTKADGEALSGLKTVNAILCCTKTSEAIDGPIIVDKWDSKTKTRVQVKVDGYPALMGKRLGLLLQQVLETDQDGKDRDRVQVFAVFNAETEMTASEMYAKATKPERLNNMFDALMAKPVRDNRKAGSKPKGSSSSGASDTDDGRWPDDIPF
jgi:hypothetical protein